MYTYIKSVVKDNRPGSRFREVDLSDSTLEYVLNDLTEVHHELSHPLLDGPVTVKVEDILSDLYKLQQTITVRQWLEINGNNALPVIEGSPVIDVGYVTAADPWAAGYDLQLSDNKGIVSTNSSRLNQVDVLVTKHDVDYGKLYDGCLVSVNGLLHLTDYSENGLIVKDAGISTGIENRYIFSFLSFAQLGKVTCHPITDEMISGINDGPLVNGVKVSIPGVDLSEKTVMVSLGGFLHYDNQDYRVTSESSINIDWWKIDIAKRYILSRKKIDLSSYMETVNDSLEEELLSLEFHNNDESIREYLKLSQSFIITIDTPHTFVEKSALETMPFPGRYRLEYKPIEPFVLSNGLLAPYVVKHEAGVYCIIVDDNWEYRYVNDLRGPDQGNWFRAGCISQYPKRLSMGHLLTVGREVCDVQQC